MAIIGLLFREPAWLQIHFFPSHLPLVKSVRVTPLYSLGALCRGQPTSGICEPAWGHVLIEVQSTAFIDSVEVRMILCYTHIFFYLV